MICCWVLRILKDQPCILSTMSILPFFSFYMCFCGPFEWSYFLIMSLALYRSQLEAA